MIKAIGSKYIIDEDEKTSEFYSIIKDLLQNDLVLQMDTFTHHVNTTCFQHCLNVSYYNYLICRKLKLDARAGARGGLLHDLFLYDWKKKKRAKGEKIHALSHGRIALANAVEGFELSDMEKNIIASHMFPLSMDMPKYKESFIITVVDKYCALAETFGVFFHKSTFRFLKLIKALYKIEENPKISMT